MIRHRRKEEGQAAVEFALVLPLFLLLVFAITEFGRVWMVQHTLTTASRSGCRRAILPTSTDTEVINVVNTFCTAASLDLSKVGVTTSNVGVNGSSGSATQVTVTYAFDILSGSMIPGFQGTFTLNSSTTMRHE